MPFKDRVGIDRILAEAAHFSWPWSIASRTKREGPLGLFQTGGLSRNSGGFNMLTKSSVIHSRRRP